MSDIELVIKIPENLYKATINGLDANEIWDLRLAVKKGTPLPKGHGRLIDVDKLELDYEWSEYETDTGQLIVDGYQAYSSTQIESAPTIIEADQSEDK